ncbi:LOW QUALITY PROTEIN: olfactory receptor 56B1-like [Esox lucius]|uniref:LOW QUALITY PROTEIN: olfactory receptor 56B1-like n=1 Tax=Esox lucius TaxID=8010 RepID=UPI001476E50B|nr:LOW QUALITY PROTEIN: olfactory receptor 56B1-like [Esox lucius]
MVEVSDENYTRVSEFVIVGFPGLHPSYFQLMAWFFFFIYVTTISGNFLLVGLFVLEKSLQKPMYIIMLSLALSDIGKILSLTLSDIGKILSLTLSDIGKILSLTLSDIGKILSLTLSDIGKILSLTLSDIGKILSLTLSDIGKILSLTLSDIGKILSLTLSDIGKILSLTLSDIGKILSLTLSDIGKILSLTLSDIGKILSLPSSPGFATVALPKVIARWWWDDGRISFHTCLFQEQMIHYFGNLNSQIMMTMAMDRYLAICHPLRYLQNNNKSSVVIVLVINIPNVNDQPDYELFNSLLLDVSHSHTCHRHHGLHQEHLSMTTVCFFYQKVAFCGPNHILHAYCDAVSLTKLACSNVVEIQGSSFGLAMFVLLVPFTFIIFSYVNIIVSVMHIANAQGRLKTFSTCATQGCIILIYYIPRFVVYCTPYFPNLTMTPDLRISLTLIYSLFPPVANPFIYCFRTKEIRAILVRWGHGWRNNMTEQNKPNSIAVITK